MRDAHPERSAAAAPASRATSTSTRSRSEEGMVVLDAVHWIQGHEAPDLAVRWNCKAAKCGSCSAEVNGRPRLMCKTRLSDFDLERADHRRADAGVPGDPRPRDGRVLELRGQQDDPAVHAARPTTAGGLALAAGGHRAGPGVPQVHRVLPVPGRLPRPARPRDREAVHGPALPRPGGGPGDASARPGGPARLHQGRRRHRLLQHHEVLHRGVPGAHQDHRQRDHPAQGARRRRVLRSDPVGSGGKLRGAKGAARAARTARPSCRGSEARPDPPPPPAPG